MLCRLSFVAMREQKGQSRRPLPLGFAGGEKLIDDHLCAVCEIAELRFPDHERSRIGEAVAIIESHDGGFGEKTVVDGVATLIGAQVIERGITFARFGIIENRMSVIKCSTLGILA